MVFLTLTKEGFFIMSELIIYKCSGCGNIAAVIENMGIAMNCCGMDMDELKANTTDAAVEKHVPVISGSGDAVEITVGSTLHPMTPEHHISWIMLHTNQGFQIKYLDKTGEPKVKFALAGADSLIAVYGYCNLHGLWKSAK